MFRFPMSLFPTHTCRVGCGNGTCPHFGAAAPTRKFTLFLGREHSARPHVEFAAQCRRAALALWVLSPGLVSCRRLNCGEIGRRPARGRQSVHASAPTDTQSIDEKGNFMRSGAPVSSMHRSVGPRRVGRDRHISLPSRGRSRKQYPGKHVAPRALTLHHYRPWSMIAKAREGLGE